MVGLFLLILIFLGLVVGLERLSQRPLVATRLGKTVALLQRAKPASYSGQAFYVTQELAAVGFKAAAQTWGEVILITPTYLAHPRLEALLVHERAHVAQYQRLTSFGFWALYLLQWLKGLSRQDGLFLAYWQMGLEREARDAEETFLAAKREL